MGNWICRRVKRGRERKEAGKGELEEGASGRDRDGEREE